MRSAKKGSDGKEKIERRHAGETGLARGLLGSEAAIAHVAQKVALISVVSMAPLLPSAGKNGPPRGPHSRRSKCSFSASGDPAVLTFCHVLLVDVLVVVTVLGAGFGESWKEPLRAECLSVPTELQQWGKHLLLGPSAPSLLLAVFSVLAL